MKFKKGNKIHFGQDFSYYMGIPHNVNFKVVRFGMDAYKLVADGYGLLDKPNAYGNGALYPHGLTKRQKERFEKALEEQKLPQATVDKKLENILEATISKIDSLYGEGGPFCKKKKRYQSILRSAILKIKKELKQK